MTAAILGQHCSFFYFGSGIILLHGTLGWVICKSMLGGSKRGIWLKLLLTMFFETIWIFCLGLKNTFPLINKAFFMFLQVLICTRLCCSSRSCSETTSLVVQLCCSLIYSFYGLILNLLCNLCTMQSLIYRRPTIFRPSFVLKFGFNVCALIIFPSFINTWKFGCVAR